MSQLMMCLGKGDPVMSKDGSSCSEPSGGPGALQKHWQKEEEMCLGWRPTFRSSTSFLPKERSLELPTMFTKEPANNTLDLGAWPDHRHGLPQPENHPSESLTHRCGAWMTMQRNVRRGNMRWSQKQGLCSACALCVLPYLMDVGIWSSAATADRQSDEKIKSEKVKYLAKITGLILNNSLCIPGCGTAFCRGDGPVG
ncbi:uncharacterized protein LOC106730690 [Camelus ferus]|uniref:Uncharacterized protein LOC106730690 n=1 Tax=Camelus ferus TaxID=419612 RepID=A0A8B8UFC5_CAMFR|nr:uncharacterized protein LOC106730690 [Camelus ferus]